MDPLIIGTAGFLALMVMLFAGAHIGVAMGLVGAIGFGMIMGLQPALGVLKTVPYTTFADFDLCVIPLFILMGNLAATSGLAGSLYRAAYAWLGHLRGGLAMATVGACACFASICGSAIATAATFGVVTLPEMKRYSYHPQLAGGCVAAGGTIGVLIPPSVIMVVYGITTETSIGKLFLAGFIPGIIQALMYMITIHLIVRFRPEFGPRGPETHLREKVKALGDAWYVLLLFLLVIGGIYAGFFTPSEAAGIGAAGAFLSLLLRRKMTWEHLKKSINDTTRTTGMVFWILLGALIFGYFLSAGSIPNALAEWISGMSPNRYVVLCLILVLLIFLGAIMDEMAIMLLTLPILFPIILHLRFDPVWFGIIMTKMMEIGMIAPPVGITVFVIAGSSDIPMWTIYKGAMPFLAADIIEVILLIIFPDIALFLPGMMN